MKKLITLLIVGVLLTNMQINAHPGKTDSYGGHYNRSTGEYHYHHGFSEHQHPNGSCPFNYENQTSHSSSSSSDTNSNVNNLFDKPEDLSTKSGSNKTKKLSAWKDILDILGICSMIIYLPWLMLDGLKWLKKYINHKLK